MLACLLSTVLAANFSARSSKALPGPNPEVLHTLALNNVSSLEPSPSPSPESIAAPAASDILSTMSALSPSEPHIVSHSCSFDQAWLVAVGVALLSCLTGVLGYSLGKRRTLKLMADGSNTSHLLGAATTPVLDSPRAMPIAKEPHSSTA